MKVRKAMLVRTLCLAGTLALAGCETNRGASSAPGSAPAPWRLEKASTVGGFNTPECVAVDPRRDVVYVSNIETATGGYWAKDRKGFISLLKPAGQIKSLRWKDSTPQSQLNAPKGMCVCDGVLYVADIDHVMSYALAGGAVTPIEIPGTQMLNDAVAWKHHVYVSDTGTGKIWKLGNPPSAIKGPPSANGLAFDADGRMYCVSWGRHDIYRVDPNGAEEPRPLGLAGQFASLDGIEVLQDGTMIVSDQKADKILAVSADCKTVSALADIDAPADIGLDRKRNILYVPMITKHEVAVYKLRRR